MKTNPLIPPRHLAEQIGDARAEAVRAAIQWYRRQKTKMAGAPQAAAA